MPGYTGRPDRRCHDFGGAGVGRARREHNGVSEPSVHDNFVLSYTVDGEARRITVRTEYRDREPNERTDVVFEGVLAYHFEGDTLNSILFDIEQAPLGHILDVHRELFARLKNRGWPVPAYDSESGLLERLESDGVKAFVVHSSYGMDGFVLAKEMFLIQMD